MKAKMVVAIGDNRVELREYDVKSFEEWDIQVRVEHSAVSAGTESHLIRTAHSDNLIIPGYSPLAVVEQVGEKARMLFSVGDRVMYFAPERPLDESLNGTRGSQSPAIIGVNPEKRDLLGPDRYCVKVPKSLNPEYAAFAGIAAVSSMGATMPGTEPGDKVLVLGQGLIGQFAAQHFRLRGAEVIVTDIDQTRLAAANQCGADHIINSASHDLVEEVQKIWPLGADIIADTTGLLTVINSSLPALRRRGKYVFLGWCKESNYSLEKLQGTRVFEAYFPWTLEGRHVVHSLRMIGQGGIKVAPLISHQPSITEAPAIYDMVVNRPHEYVGIVFNWKDLA